SSSFHFSSALFLPFLTVGAGVPSYSTILTVRSGSMSSSLGSTASSAASSLLRRSFQALRWRGTLVLSRRSTKSLLRASIFAKSGSCTRRCWLLLASVLASQPPLFHGVKGRAVVLLHGIE